jgi:short-subunit dehydrogenase
MPAVVEKLIINLEIDLLINNAGLSQRSLAMETSIEVDKRLMDVDL